MSKFPDWAVPGADVMIYTPSRWGAASAEPATITRVTGASVFAREKNHTGAETRFVVRSEYRPELVQYGRKYDFSSRPTPELIRPDDPRVAVAKEEQAREGAKSKAVVAMDKWERSKDDMDRSRAAADALTAWAEYLETHRS